MPDQAEPLPPIKFQPPTPEIEHWYPAMVKDPENVSDSDLERRMTLEDLVAVARALPEHARRELRRALGCPTGEEGYEAVVARAVAAERKLDIAESEFREATQVALRERDQARANLSEVERERDMWCERAIRLGPLEALREAIRNGSPCRD